MRLAELITGTQVVSLLNETDGSVALALHDQETGAVTRVDITADLAWPDEALLTISAVEADIQPVGEPVYADTFANTNRALQPLWAITPQGMEIDLRDQLGGLF